MQLRRMAKAGLHKYSSFRLPAFLCGGFLLGMAQWVLITSTAPTALFAWTVKLRGVALLTPLLLVLAWSIPMFSGVLRYRALRAYHWLAVRLITMCTSSCAVLLGMALAALLCWSVTGSGSALGAALGAAMFAILFALTHSILQSVRGSCPPPSAAARHWR